MAQVFRKRLTHNAHFAGRFGAVYFITICCQKRGSNQLCNAETAQVLIETGRIYHEKMRWQVGLIVLMPDHLHGLVSVDGRDSLAEIIRSYKRITSKLARITWQRNFFDHRLRHDESFREKFAYVRNNPVRAGLAREEDDWPYLFIPQDESLKAVR